LLILSAILIATSSFLLSYNDKKIKGGNLLDPLTKDLDREYDANSNRIFKELKDAAILDLNADYEEKEYLYDLHQECIKAIKNDIEDPIKIYDTDVFDFLINNFKDKLYIVYLLILATRTEDNNVSGTIFDVISNNKYIWEIILIAILELLKYGKFTIEQISSDNKKIYLLSYEGHPDEMYYYSVQLSDIIYILAAENYNFDEFIITNSDQIEINKFNAYQEKFDSIYKKKQLELSIPQNRTNLLLENDIKKRMGPVFQSSRKKEKKFKRPNYEELLKSSDSKSIDSKSIENKSYRDEIGKLRIMQKRLKSSNGEESIYL